MDENENELDLNLTDNSGELSRKDIRIKSLSDKVKLTSEERDEKDRLLKERDEQLANASKEREFYKNFNGIASKYQGASEYQDKILEKVNAGYDIEDATISILHKEGKFTSAQPQEQREISYGGSATTSMPNENKSVKEMSSNELRNELLEAEKRGELNIF